MPDTPEHEGIAAIPAERRFTNYMGAVDEEPDEFDCDPLDNDMWALDIMSEIEFDGVS